MVTLGNAVLVRLCCVVRESKRPASPRFSDDIIGYDLSVVANTHAVSLAESQAGWVSTWPTLPLPGFLFHLFYHFLTVSVASSQTSHMAAHVYFR